MPVNIKINVSVYRQHNSVGYLLNKERHILPIIHWNISRSLKPNEPFETEIAAVMIIIKWDPRIQAGESIGCFCPQITYDLNALFGRLISVDITWQPDGIKKRQ